MTTQAVGQAILDDVCRDPRDWTPRHVYADWCEDNGRPQRAALIRAMLAGRAEEASWMFRPIAPDLDCPDLLDHAIPNTYRLVSVDWCVSDVPFTAAHEDVVALSFAPAGDSGRRRRWQKGYLRGGFFEGWELRLRNWVANADQYLSECPLRGIRLLPNSTHAREQHGDLVRLWQSAVVGRLETLDLSQLLTDARDVSVWLGQSCHAFRPWRGLRQLKLPSWINNDCILQLAHLLPETQLVLEARRVDHS